MRIDVYRFANSAPSTETESALTTFGRRSGTLLQTLFTNFAPRLPTAVDWKRTMDIAKLHCQGLFSLSFGLKVRIVNHAIETVHTVIFASSTKTHDWCDVVGQLHLEIFRAIRWTGSAVALRRQLRFFPPSRYILEMFPMERLFGYEARRKIALFNPDL